MYGYFPFICDTFRLAFDGLFLFVTGRLASILESSSEDVLLERWSMTFPSLILCKLWVNSCHFEANLVWDISLLVAGSNCCRFVVSPGSQIHGSDLLLNVGPLNERTFFFLQVHDLVFGKFEKDLVCPRRLESQGLFSTWPLENK